MQILWQVLLGVLWTGAVGSDGAVEDSPDTIVSATFEEAFALYLNDSLPSAGALLEECAPKDRRCEKLLGDFLFLGPPYVEERSIPEAVRLWNSAASRGDAEAQFLSAIWASSVFKNVFEDENEWGENAQGERGVPENSKGGGEKDSGGVCSIAPPSETPEGEEGSTSAAPESGCGAPGGGSSLGSEGEGGGGKDREKGGREEAWGDEDPLFRRDGATASLFLYAASLSGHVGAMMANGYRHTHGYMAPLRCQTAALNYVEVARNVSEAHSLGMPQAVELIRLSTLAGPSAASPSLGFNSLLLSSLSVSLDRQREGEASLFLHLADGGDVVMQAAVGRRFLLGVDGFPQDYARAFKYLSSAAQKGSGQAVALIGFAHCLGLGVEKNRENAFRRFKEAVDKHEDPLAHNGLGYLYFHGFGDTPRDVEKAFAHFNESAQGGNADGAFNLASLYLTGTGTAQSFQRALIWFTKALDKGHTPAAYSLAVMHLNGLGTMRDCQTAVSLFKRVAERGEWLTQALQKAYAHESRRPLLSAFLFWQLAEAGHEVSQSNLAFLLDKQGVDLFGLGQRKIRRPFAAALGEPLSVRVMKAERDEKMKKLASAASRGKLGKGKRNAGGEGGTEGKRKAGGEGGTEGKRKAGGEGGTEGGGATGTGGGEVVGSGDDDDAELGGSPILSGPRLILLRARFFSVLRMFLWVLLFPIRAVWSTVNRIGLFVAKLTWFRFVEPSDRIHSEWIVNKEIGGGQGDSTRLWMGEGGSEETAARQGLQRALAQRYLEMAKAQGSDAAGLRLGDFAFFGWGLERSEGILPDPSAPDSMEGWLLTAQRVLRTRNCDFREAAALYRETADGSAQGPWAASAMATAAFNLGTMAQWGLGVPQDFVAAGRYFDRAAQLDPSKPRTPIRLAKLLLTIHKALEESLGGGSGGRRKVLHAALSDSRHRQALLTLHIWAVIVLLIARFCVKKATSIWEAAERRAEANLREAEDAGADGVVVRQSEGGLGEEASSSSDSGEVRRGGGEGGGLLGLSSETREGSRSPQQTSKEAGEGGRGVQGHTGIRSEVGIAVDPLLPFPSSSSSSASASSSSSALPAAVSASSSSSSAVASGFSFDTGVGGGLRLRAPNRPVSPAEESGMSPARAAFEAARARFESQSTDHSRVRDVKETGSSGIGPGSAATVVQKEKEGEKGDAADTLLGMSTEKGDLEETKEGLTPRVLEENQKVPASFVSPVRENAEESPERTVSGREEVEKPKEDAESVVW
uniref:Uncharacterized protein n=1 Tax=Chromera velia CCMP2878 TaxID=1169474 RepID=A0A0G4GXF5_9ALVE|eukprot:Cvel_5364.t1-p1 / transcript=Cvel_5364.t1 / gene=Cvel_5364 / organism=Chromera_velia_CCMP2878 / gene_product=Protein sel-1 homolog 1, putative / transcript_product=Protein sel-1 homolog 1, putative / location=Cvel_scaffold249:41866-51973(-) / protein_length=1255 / sequence_SO=supercontig / SO=protein_coding / is_pseudo=false